MPINILPAITTISPGGWQKKIAEIDELDIKSAALFLTVTDAKQRTELYSLLEKTQLQSAPFVHLRSDMSPDELDYLVDRWGTKVFNIHSLNEYPLKYDLTKFADRIFVEENTIWPWQEDEIRQWAGICIDFSHLEAARLSDTPLYENWINIIEKYPIGCAHISAIGRTPRVDKFDGTLRHDKHWLDDISELDYLKNYPKKYFPPYIAVELENSLSEQVKFREYIAKILDL